MKIPDTKVRELLLANRLPNLHLDEKETHQFSKAFVCIEFHDEEQIIHTGAGQSMLEVKKYTFGDIIGAKDYFTSNANYVQANDVWASSHGGVLACITTRAVDKMHASYPSLAFKFLWAIGRTVTQLGVTSEKLSSKAIEMQRNLSFLPDRGGAGWRPLTFKDAEILTEKHVSRQSELPLNKLQQLSKKGDLNSLQCDDLMRLAEDLSSELKLIQNINQGNSDKLVLSDSLRNSLGCGPTFPDISALRTSQSQSFVKRRGGMHSLLRTSTSQGSRTPSDPTAGDRTAALQQCKIQNSSLQVKIGNHKKAMEITNTKVVQMKNELREKEEKIMVKKANVSSVQEQIRKLQSSLEQCAEDWSVQQMSLKQEHKVQDEKLRSVRDQICDADNVIKKMLKEECALKEGESKLREAEAEVLKLKDQIIEIVKVIVSVKVEIKKKDQENMCKNCRRNNGRSPLTLRDQTPRRTGKTGLLSWGDKVKRSNGPMQRLNRIDAVGALRGSSSRPSILPSPLGPSGRRPHSASFDCPRKLVEPHSAPILRS